MTPNWIRSVAAACLAATLMPAQEEHEVIVRVEKSQGAKASSKATVKHKVTHKKMMKIIERISDDDVPSKERKKLTKQYVQQTLPVTA